AFAIWEKYMPSKRIVRFGEKENFWSMGDVGPCGPCAELLYDRGSSYSDAKSPIYDVSGERYLEFWNLVFMQFNKDETGKMNPLPKKSIDTGAGLERVVSLKMGVDSVFLTDTFQAIISHIEEISKIKYNPKNLDLAPAFHVIADHIRCLSFAITDGIIPSNVDRGYVLRKILRRAVRYGKMLNLNKPFLAKLLPGLSSIMGDDFPEIIKSEDRTAEVLTLEEELFIKTLQRGGNLMSQVLAKAKSENDTIDGEMAFKLKDTYGFPIEEILLIAKDEHVKVDLNKYNELENLAKERSRQAQEKHSQKFDENFFADFTKVNPPNNYLGHKTYETEAKISAIIKNDKFTDEIEENDFAFIILDKTPFYAQMGGQVGDKGKITKGGVVFDVVDTQNPYPGVIVHIGKLIKGKLKKQDKVHASIDIERRKKIEANHSATHLLQFALSKTLGEHIKQAGSLVDENKLRFDFDHNKALSNQEVRQIERLINEKIRENTTVRAYEIPFEEAKKDSSIRQIFGEKYSDIVRVIDINYSKELCGGCHTSFTGNIGYFRIFKESSISQGVRRIEAVTGAAAEDFVYDTEDLLNNISATLKTIPNKLEEKITSLVEEHKELIGKLKANKELELNQLFESLLKKAEKLNSYTVIMQEVEVDPKDLKNLSDKLLEHLKSALVVLATKVDSRCQISINITPDLIAKNIFANDLIKIIAPVINGGGGGKKESAQAGGADPSKITQAFELLKKEIRKK
ncbi:MAG: alanine--tRNA ligase, partial [Parachlamydiales bacterium]